MAITQTVEGIYKLSTSIRDILFEGLWEIPNGVTLNSYVVKGERTAIVDGFCGWEGVPETFFTMLDEMQVPLESIDYIIINHMEPDHSGWIEEIRALKDDVVVVCSKASERLLKAFYNYEGPIRVVRDGDTLDLGGGRCLEFYSIPNVHWPDAIVTLDKLSGTLFSCDAFGSFGTFDGKDYDDQLAAQDYPMLEKEVMRYYANIIATFSNFVLKALDKLKRLEIRTVAPGHGIVWRQSPEAIVDMYRRIAGYSSGEAKSKVAVLWGSMYGMTERGLKAVLKGLDEAGAEYEVLNVAEASLGSILASVWDASGIVLAMPTYENKMFPTMAAVLDELGKKRVQNRQAFRIGSFGWSGGAEKELAAIMERHAMNWTFLPSVEFCGAPSTEDLEAIEARVKELWGTVLLCSNPLKTG